MLVHGMGTGARAWDGVEAGALRTIAYDRRGYNPAESEPYEGTTVAEQGEDLARVIAEHDAAPAVLVGRDFGALVVLDVLTRRPGLAHAAVLVAPLVLELVRGAADDLVAERIALGEIVHSDGPKAAMERYVGHPTDAPPAAFFADYTALGTAMFARRDLRRLRHPVTVLEGDDPTPPILLAARELARTIPEGELRTGEDVGAVLRERWA